MVEGLQGSPKEGNKAAQKGVADIIFCIDITGSMKPCIDGLIENLKKFIDTLEGTANNDVEVEDWRAKVYYFGDLDEDPEEYSWNDDNDWVDEPEKLKDQLENLKPIVDKKLGGDEPESSFDAIYMATTQGFDKSFTDRTRCLAVFTDAPPKKIKKIPIKGEEIKILADKINNEHVKLFLYSIEDEEYSILSTKVNGMYYEPIEKKNKYSGLENADFEKLVEILGKTISEVSITS